MGKKKVTVQRDGDSAVAYAEWTVKAIETFAHDLDRPVLADLRDRLENKESH